MNYKIGVLKKEWLLLPLIVILVCYTIIRTYSNFFVLSNNHKASEMYVTELTYKIEKDGVEINKLTVSPGETVVSLTIKSSDIIDSKFKLAYKNNENIEITYFNDESTPYGSISSGETKNIKISIDNKSLENIEVEFIICGGYSFNDINSITIPDNFNEINTEVNKWYYLCDANTDNLNCNIIRNDIPSDKESSEFVTSSTGVNYASISSDTNGKGIYYVDGEQTEDGKRVYYYRGAVVNNYVKFANYCWRIIRTNENGSIRLRYDGSPVNGNCIQTGNTANITTIAFGNTPGYNAGMGYMYGTANSSTYQKEHENINDSLAKTTLDNWYIQNIASNESYKNKIDNVIYCNDRSISNRDKIGGTTNTKKGYGTNITFYGFPDRVVATGSWAPLSDGKPTYRCPQTNDAFTLSEESGGISGYGNNKLTYPIGLLTADEGVFAGGVRYTATNSNTQNKTYYLYTGEWYLTMSPAFFTNKLTVKHANMAQIRNNGSIDFDSVFGKEGAIYPVISLKSTSKITGGTGLYNDPYIIE